MTKRPPSALPSRAHQPRYSVAPAALSPAKRQEPHHSCVAPSCDCLPRSLPRLLATPSHHASASQSGRVRSASLSRAVPVHRLPYLIPSATPAPVSGHLASSLVIAAARAAGKATMTPARTKYGVRIREGGIRVRVLRRRGAYHHNSPLSSIYLSTPCSQGLPAGRRCDRRLRRSYMQIYELRTYLYARTACACVSIKPGHRAEDCIRRRPLTCASASMLCIHEPCKRSPPKSAAFTAITSPSFSAR